MKDSKRVDVIAGGLTEESAQALRRDLVEALTGAEQSSKASALSRMGMDTERETATRPRGPSLSSRVRVAGLVLVGQVMGFAGCFPVFPVPFLVFSPNAIDRLFASASIDSRLPILYAVLPILF